MNNEIKELLTEIQDWMLDNDYECGEQGSDIYQRITEILEEEETVDNTPTVTINGKSVVLPTATLTYESVLKILQIDPALIHTPLYTVTYFRGKNNTEGSLVPGGKPAFAKTGTVINAYFTGNA